MSIIVLTFFSATITGYIIAISTYNVLFVTPLSFLHIGQGIIPVSIVLLLALLALSIIIKDVTSLIVVTATLYILTLYLPKELFYFKIYNDQLGFALEAIHGYITGHVVPYQGELATLGHAFFTVTIGRLLGIDCLDSIRLATFFWTVTTYIIFVAFALSKASRYSTFISLASILLFYPAFQLDPMTYSRFFFGLTLFLPLLFLTIMYICEFSVRTLILLILTFVATSISYPIHPLLIAFSLVTYTLLILSIKTFRIAIKNNTGSSLKMLFMTAVLLLALWLTVQIFIGKSPWSVIREIIARILSGEPFSASLSSSALKYASEAEVYTILRELMIISGWVIAFLLITYMLVETLVRRRLHRFTVFSLSILVTLGILGLVYFAGYHDPAATRLYRTLIATVPFILAGLVEPIDVKYRLNSVLSVFVTVIFALSLVFVVLSPITRWGWTFVAYPTVHDLALSNFIINNSESGSVIYSPGSHELLWFLTNINAIHNKSINVKFIGCDNIFVNASILSNVKLTAVFYRSFIYPRWYGINICKHLDRTISDFDVVYNDYPWLVLANFKHSYSKFS